VLGHRDFKMTLRYSHLSPAHLRAAVDRLDGLTPAAQGMAPGTVERIEQPLEQIVGEATRSASL
jgi:hypothetical protein